MELILYQSLKIAEIINVIQLSINQLLQKSPKSILTYLESQKVNFEEQDINWWLAIGEYAKSQLSKHSMDDHEEHKHVEILIWFQISDRVYEVLAEASQGLSTRASFDYRRLAIRQSLIESAELEVNEMLLNFEIIVSLIRRRLSAFQVDNTKRKNTELYNLMRQGDQSQLHERVEDALELRAIRTYVLMLKQISDNHLARFDEELSQWLELHGTIL